MGQPEGAGSGKRHAGSRRVVLARPSGRLYGTAMRVPGARFISPCLPSPCQKAPSGREWVHEIKHDGHRLIARRDGNRVRLFTRRGYDWSRKHPWIVDSLLSLRVRSKWMGKRSGAVRTGSRISTGCTRMRMMSKCSCMASTYSN